MKLQARFLVLLVAIFSAVTGLLFIQHRLNIERTNTLLTSESEQRKQYLNSIVALDGESLKTFSEDYSFWDEMVTFVKTKNPTFAQQNIDSGLQTFNADAAWVFSPTGVLVYKATSDNSKQLSTIQFSKQLFSDISKKKFVHFYEQTTAGVMEIRASTIVPTADTTHSTTPQGYWLVGRLLNADYTNNISQLTKSIVKVNPQINPAGTVINGSLVSVANVLHDWDNSEVAELRSVYNVAVIDSLNHSYTQQLKLVFGLSLVIILISFVYIWRLVLKPLNIIGQAIKTQQPSKLEPVAKLETEMGELAQTVKQFFSQKVTIAKTEFEKTELEKLHKEKIAFLAVAAHELNGPVNAVRLFAEYVTFLIKKHGDQKLIDKMLDRISHQINKANMLINDLHGASEGIQNMQFSMKEVDFDSFLEEEIDQAAFTVKHKLLLSGRTGQKVLSDPDRLGQVVSNLLRNAYKYSPDAETIHITAKVDNGQVVVGVQDFGLGISKEDQQHIFERFYRSSKVSELFPGLGLGLAISKQIIEKLGGKIWVDSIPNYGSTFYFSLPAIGANQEQASEPEPQVAHEDSQHQEPEHHEPEHHED
jgi:signal transduction histidine kinase